MICIIEIKDAKQPRHNAAQTDFFGVPKTSFLCSALWRGSSISSRCLQCRAEF